MNKIMLIILLCIMLIGCVKERDFTVEADVLSINENILQGELIGHFLSSPDGMITNDKIKVGVSFKICDKILLYDINLQHAELAYYKGKNKIPLDLHLYTEEIGNSFITVWLNGRKTGTMHLGHNLTRYLADCEKQ